MNPLLKAMRHLVWLTQLGLSLAAPPLLMIWLCWYLQKRFLLGSWVMVVGIVVGLISSGCSAYRFYRRTVQQNRKQEKPPASFNRHN